MREVPVFSTSLHGFQCQRGQLWLSDEECANLSDFLHSYGFCFTLDSRSGNSPNTKRQKVTTNDTVSTQQKTKAKKNCSVEMVETKKNEDIPSVTPYLTGKHRRTTALRHSTTTVSSPEKLSKSTSNAPPQQSNSRITTQNPVMPSQPSSRSLRSLLPVRMTQRCRRKVLSGNWVDACLHVTQILEGEPSAQWFLTPVDTNSQAVPDYFSKLSCPMDFQTIKQKLTHRMYSHPFRWQEDIRTIFYNTFAYYEPGNLIWSNACYLAGLFERLCRENEGVNPYAVYSQTSPSKTETNQYGKTLSTSSHKSLRTRGSLNSRHATSDISLHSEDVTGSINNMFSKSSKIVLEASKLRELLKKAATVAQQASCKDSDSSENTRKYEHGGSSGKGPFPYNDTNGDTTHSARSSLNESTHTYSTPGGKTLKLYTSCSPQMPKPTLPKPPPPPFITTMVPGDRIPSIIHQRLVSSQFRQLDVHLRFAALELVKDELGINPEIAAADPDFRLDLEILSFLKQKQLLTYLRTLNTFQRKKVEEGYSVTLATQLRYPSGSNNPHHASVNTKKFQNAFSNNTTAKSHSQSDNQSYISSHPSKDPKGHCEKTPPTLKDSRNLSSRPTMFVPNSATRLNGSSASSTYSSSSYSQDDNDMSSTETSSSFDDPHERDEYGQLNGLPCNHIEEATTLQHCQSSHQVDFDKKTILDSCTGSKDRRTEDLNNTCYARRDLCEGGKNMNVLQGAHESSPSGLHIKLNVSQTSSRQDHPSDYSDQSCPLSSFENYATLDRADNSTAQNFPKRRGSRDQLILDERFEEHFDESNTQAHTLEYYHSNPTSENTLLLNDPLQEWEDQVDSETLPSVWGKWKAQIIQQTVQERIGDEENQVLLNTERFELERAAELADAQI